MKDLCSFVDDGSVPAECMCEPADLEPQRGADSCWSLSLTEGAAANECACVFGRGDTDEHFVIGCRVPAVLSQLPA